MLYSMAGVFSVLPDSFFSPLASPNKGDYAACLLIFYRLFQESPGGVERSTLVSRFAEYIAQTGHSFADEEGSDSLDGESEGTIEEGNTVDSDEAEGSDEGSDTPEGGRDPDRAMASHILRRLTSYGWLGEEVLPDYTRMITLASHAKPFFDALNAVESGGALEYESHVVAIYSSLCTDAAKDYGHHAVLNAHYHVSLLIDSLKVLSQNIRSHYERLMSENSDAEVSDILRLHYDKYLEEVVDRAYARLKTSDNLSKYRPRIIKAVNTFLADKAWMAKTASALALLRREPVEEGRRRLKALLEDIRDQLKGLDPTLDDIDRRNMIYARSSLEGIRSRLRSDATVAGRLIEIARAVVHDEGLSRRLSHRIHRARWFGKESRYNRWFREGASPMLRATPKMDALVMERAEAELRLRIARQLSPERIAAWLDERVDEAGFAWAHELAVDQEAFVRVLHATAYGEAHRLHFPYTVEWDQGLVEGAQWIFKKHGYRRRR